MKGCTIFRNTGAKQMYTVVSKRYLYCLITNMMQFLQVHCQILTQWFCITERTQWRVLFSVATCFRGNRGTWGTTVTTTSARRGGASYRHSVPGLWYSDTLFLCFVKVALASPSLTATPGSICDQTGEWLVGKATQENNSLPNSIHVHTFQIIIVFYCNFLIQCFFQRWVPG